MPLVPERLRSRQDVKASISSQFWEQPVHSTKSVDGQLWSLPCEPPALNLTGSSGLSRTQQLLAAQAIRVPFFPSYDGASEGLVLDRVLVKTGGQRWWATLTGRAKAQRAYNLAAGGKVSKVEAVRDLGNYALCARGRFKLGRRLTLNGMVEAPDTQQLRQRLAQTRALRRQPPAGAGPVEAAGGSGGDGGAAAGISSEIAPAAEIAPPRLSRLGPGAAGSSSSSRSRIIPELEPCTAHATLRCVLPGHDLSATAGYNLQYSDSTGDVAHIPLAVSLDLASHDRQDGLQYRVGLHQVTAPPTEGPAKAGSLQRWRTSLYAQGAVAVEGEAHIWKSAGPNSSSGGVAAGTAAAATAAGSSSGSPPGVAEAPPPPGAAAAVPKQPKGGGGVGGEEAGSGGEETRGTKLASALASAAAAEEEESELLPLIEGGGKEGSSTRGKTAEAVRQQAGNEAAADGVAGGGQKQAAHRAAVADPHARAGPTGAAAGDGPVGTLPEAAPAGGAAAAGAEAAGSRQPGINLEEFIKPLEQMKHQVTDMLHHYTHPQQAGEGGSSSGGEPGEQQQQPAQNAAPGGSSSSGQGSLLGVSSQSISATIVESVALLQQVKESVERLTSNVQDGSLQRLSQQLADSRQTPQRRRPYSMLLAQPHLKLNAAIGCLARMPLPALRTFSFPHASLEPLEGCGGGSSGGGSSGGGSGGGLLAGGGGSGAAQNRHGSSASLVSRASHSSQLAESWEPYFKGTALRVFASAGVSGQLGRFTRPFLDYTAASARIDVGLTSPHVVGVVPDPSTLAADSAHRPDNHRAFALEGRGSWHALSLSLAQQVFGPVRARVDARFALDPTSVPANEGERSTLKGVMQTALSVRPSLLETVYGFDMVLPGTEGAARVAVWFSPKRRECMAELRLF